MTAQRLCKGRLLDVRSENFGSSEQNSPGEWAAVVLVALLPFATPLRLAKLALHRVICRTHPQPSRTDLCQAPF
jgi:hypothetical protein